MYATMNFILYEERKCKQFNEISDFKDSLEIINSMQ